MVSFETILGDEAEMTGKTIQISTRINQKDADFLAGLSIEGALTPSDKLRALIDEARRRREGVHEYGAGLKHTRELVGPALDRTLQIETQGLPHSELIPLVGEWLAESMAYLISGIPEDGPFDDAEEAQLREVERGLAERVFRLLQQVLRLGVTKDAPCYDSGLVARSLSPALELLEVLRLVHGAPPARGAMNSRDAAGAGS